MDMVKNIFPFSFNFKEKDTNGLIVSIIIYIVLMLVSGIVMWVLGMIPVINILTGIVGWIIEIYAVAGIVLSVLNYFNVLK
ncbi:MAG: hypothetical protein IJV82_00340 [Oscillospiraceae bacterium]|nr:hypothetical protein [Oscillospiraceae bacterium]